MRYKPLNLWGRMRLILVTSCVIPRPITVSGWWKYAHPMVDPGAGTAYYATDSSSARYDRDYVLISRGAAPSSPVGSRIQDNVRYHCPEIVDAYQ
ncbi:uncharacterized protein EI90DRAFT_3035292 [Cantharellus anzutake]|uniref:uncharacterized protein n=1 Tax=Cantharellus anzutake TaxID=1750568 RepID=UPI001907BF4E|nr:uncharacterized protein EI90DRAFT_3035292 [Cantharellus anzutake]KAF8340356.1 hypothetical protein EI90DRAFT_3035292 [Cantharellus anzutake]